MGLSTVMGALTWWSGPGVSEASLSGQLAFFSALMLLVGSRLLKNRARNDLHILGH